MQAILLAAGKSSRFFPYNATLEHKSLIKMMGKTLLEHTIESLEKSGIDNIVIVVGKNSKIPGTLSQKKSVNITFVEQQAPLGMGDALLSAKRHLEEKFFVLGAYHMDIIDFAKDMRNLQKDERSVLLVRKDDVVNRYGNVLLEKEKVIEIIEKPQKNLEGNYRLLAIYFLTKAFIQELEETPAEEYHFEKALNTWAKKNHVYAVITEKPTVTLKYAWDLLGIKNYLLDKQETSFVAKNTHIAKDVVISGNVVIESGVTLLEGVCIKGPAHIGKGVTIGNRAILRGGIIVEDNSVIGSQMEIKNTFVMENTTTHSGFIGDSIIGSATKIAGGFLTANVRLDRQPVAVVIKGEKINTGLRHFGAILGNKNNIGIRVSVMPGVVVGNNVIVGPSTTIMKSIEDNKKYYTKFTEVVEENNER